MKLLESEDEKIIRRAKTVFKALKTGTKSIKVKGVEVELVRYELPVPLKIRTRIYTDDEKKGTSLEDFAILYINTRQIKYYSEYTNYKPEEDVFKYPYKSSLEYYISDRFEKFGVRIKWEDHLVIDPRGI